MKLMLAIDLDIVALMASEVASGEHAVTAAKRLRAIRTMSFTTVWPPA